MLGIFYQTMRLAYQGVFGEQHMLHYPLYRDEGQSLMEGQQRFTDYCLSFVPQVRGKRVLEIGCGNGVQSMYIRGAYDPAYVYAVDINRMHIDMARREKAERGLDSIDFAIDDSQTLSTVADESFDIVICTESAHHYPDKSAFLRQVKRVLRPDGRLVIADLLQREPKPPGAIERKMFLYYWSVDKYRSAFAETGITLTATEDFTGQILRAFDATDGWFPRAPDAGAAGYHLGRFFGKGLIRLYSHQLTHSLHYQILAGQKAGN